MRRYIPGLKRGWIQGLRGWIHGLRRWIAAVVGADGVSGWTLACKTLVAWITSLHPDGVIGIGIGIWRSRVYPSVPLCTPLYPLLPACCEPAAGCCCRYSPVQRAAPAPSYPALDLYPPRNLKVLVTNAQHWGTALDRCYKRVTLTWHSTGQVSQMRHALHWAQH